MSAVPVPDVRPAPRALPAERSGEPAAKRQKREASMDSSASPIDAAALPPFPPRPRRPRPVGSAPTAVAGPKLAVSTKPYTLEAPRTAPQYAGGRSADFRPWRGHAAEDVLSEATIKHGNYDKSTGTQNESGSARPLIWASVKHKSGLALLSSLFAAMLAQRQAAGAIVAPSTFKPPPRVTLTDAKREAWLRDLADAAVPLRRLSRSIPHGIRGPALLDHCLRKRIPTGRAVWLARCVGANEIRAFKRKGPTSAFASGGEIKWLRDWTGQVQQFVDDVVAAAGADDWPEDFRYGLRLVRQLYGAQLVDCDVFIDWLLAATQAARPSRLPIWLLVLSLFWMPALRSRRHGQRLAVTLSEQLLVLQTAGVSDANRPLWQKLAGAVRALLRHQPACFLLPPHWPRFAAVLRQCADDDDPTVAARLEQLARRNARFAPSATANDTARQRLIRLLDATGAGFNYAELAEQCRATAAHDVLVSTLVQWATTPFRTGAARLYLAVRLLRRWARDLDLDAALTIVLAHGASLAGQEAAAVQKLLAELVRSRHFTLGKYLQWLLARGVAPGPFERGLLRSIPLHGLPEHILNLRYILLGAGVDADLEAVDSLEVAKACCEVQIPLLASDSAEAVGAPMPLAAKALVRLDRSSQLEVARWLRQRLAACLASEVSEESDDEASSHLTLDDFHAIGAIFDVLDDPPVLADIHRLVVEQGDASLLCDVVDSIHRHFDTFYAIGAAPDLFARLIARRGDVRGRLTHERRFLAALVDLAQRFPDLTQSSDRLRAELAAGEPAPAMAMHSPAAEEMADALENADSLEEVDMLLSSGTVLDRPVFARVFADMMKRLDSAWTEQYISVRLLDIVAKLRGFGPADYDALMAAWLVNTLRAPQRPPLAPLVVSAVCGGIATLDDFCTAASGPVSGDQGRILAVELVRLIAERKAPPLALPRLYRFEQSCTTMRRQPPPTLATLITIAVESCAVPAQAAMATELVHGTAFASLVIDCVASGNADLENAFVTLKPTIEVIDSVLGIAVQSGSPLLALLAVANDFNARLAQLRLAHLATSLELHPPADDFAPRFVHQMAAVEAASDGTWQRLAADLPPSVCLPALQHATLTILQRLEAEGDIGDDVGNGDGLDLAALIAVAGAVERAVKPDDSVPLLEALTAPICQLQVRFQVSEPIHRAMQALSVRLAPLLDLLAVFQRALNSPHASAETLTQLTIALAQLLAAPLSTQLGAHLFDSLVLLSDALPSEPRAHAAHILRSQHHLTDPRLDWLLGDESAFPSAGLALAVPESAYEPPAVATREPSTLQQGITMPESPRPGTLAGMSGAPTRTEEHSGVRLVPFQLRPWEMVQDSTPVVGENDASLSLTLFGARKALL